MYSIRKNELFYIYFRPKLYKTAHFEPAGRVDERNAVMEESVKFEYEQNQDGRLRV